MKKKYYIYAGYYELWISDVKLGKPLTYQAECDTLEDAIVYIQEEFDETICFSESLTSEVLDFFGFVPGDEEIGTIPFFNEQEYKLAA